MSDPRPKILIIDDEPDVLECLGLMIESDKYQILTASNGAEALELLKQHTFQAVITDYRMPLMDGLTLLAEVRKLQLDLPFIFLSGNANEIKHLKKGKNGFCLLLPKLEIGNIPIHLAKIIQDHEEFKEKGSQDVTMEFDLKQLLSQ